MSNFLNTAYPTSLFIKHYCLHNVMQHQHACNYGWNTVGEESPSSTRAQANHPLWNWGVRGQRAECTHMCANQNPHFTFPRSVCFSSPPNLPTPPTQRPSHPPPPQPTNALLSFSSDDYPCCFSSPICQSHDQKFKWLYPMMHHSELLCWRACAVTNFASRFNFILCDLLLVLVSFAHKRIHINLYKYGLPNVVSFIWVKDQCKDEKCYI